MTKVILHTNHGDILLELNSEKAPLTTLNFINYVMNGHYNGKIFHRVINDFMIQGGGMNENMQETHPAYAPIKNEANNGLKNDKYTIAMARTNDPHSATSQFFINVKNNDFLNFKAENLQGWGYAVFGQVISGTEVVDKIKVLETTTHGIHNDVPIEPCIIINAKVIQD